MRGGSLLLTAVDRSVLIIIILHCRPTSTGVTNDDLPTKVYSYVFHGPILLLNDNHSIEMSQYAQMLFHQFVHSP